MRTLTCMIIDDEPASRDILKRYICELPGLSLECECRDAFEASEKLSENSPDLLFLDINMPRLSGISFARSLSRAPLIIFTTAYPEYAVEGFELEAVDYLVKPYSFERFLKAVNRAFDRLEQAAPGEQKESTLLIRSDRKIYNLRTSELSWIEGCGDYIKVHLQDGKMLVVHDTIKDFIGGLPQRTFMRIHRSYVVNVSRIEYIEGNMVHIEGTSVPASPVYRQELLDRLG